MLKEGDTVEVVVQGVDDRGKISLAIPASKIRNPPLRAVSVPIAMTVAAAVAVVMIVVPIVTIVIMMIVRVVVVPIAMTVTTIAMIVVPTVVAAAAARPQSALRSRRELRRVPCRSRRAFRASSPPRPPRL